MTGDHLCATMEHIILNPIVIINYAVITILFVTIPDANVVNIVTFCASVHPDLRKTVIAPDVVAIHRRRPLLGITSLRTQPR
jgi:hypothetical protein